MSSPLRLRPATTLIGIAKTRTGTPLLLGYGAESFRRPRRLFHECSDSASVILAFGYDGMGGGVPGPEPVLPINGFLRLWLVTFVARTSFRIFLESILPPVRYHPSPQLPLFDFRPRVADYPRVWSLDEIAHQHFLACTWLSFWCIEERGPANWPIRVFWLCRAEHHTMPSIFDELLDRMLLVRLFPEVYPDTPKANRKANLAGLRSQLLSFRRLEGSPRHGPAPFEAPPGIARICLISTREPDVCSRFQASPDSSVHSAQGEAVRILTEGVLGYHDEIASSNGRWSHPEDTATPGRILVGDELDLEIIAAGLPPSNFIGATLPMPPPPPSPTPAPSPPIARPPSPPQSRCWRRTSLRLHLSPRCLSHPRSNLERGGPRHIV
ncbi:hypothetical protein DFH08DRAFT_976238 [Mycena albidolilacea]|uniref:Uncharacterized protein n=1 Tax=Mycena albidolilacea TaxID=1033008 RepID=A0AAD7EAG3_9AGAR|nr:hypothetical protein DFH08DRAFT_976238 [Mycena albidolilacea]